MFTKEQIEYLKTTTKSYSELAKEFNLNKDQIRYFYKKNSISKLKSSKSLDDLTEEQIEKFKNEFQDRSILSFIDEFNSSESILIKLTKKLGLVKERRVITNKRQDAWIETDIKFLKENYTNCSIEELSEKLNRSDKAIKKKLWELKLIYITSDSKWSEEEIKFLKENFQNGLEVVAFFLERSFKGVRHKADQLGLYTVSKKETSIEIQMKKILDNLCIDYIYDSRLSDKYMYRPDFVIKNSKIIFECFGDYWHANPNFYDEDELNMTQEVNVSKDSRKKQIYESLGYSYNIIWESEFQNEEKVIEKVKNTLNIKTA